MTSWPDAASPAEAAAQWHTEAAKHDEEYLAQGPVDMTETTDGPWSGAAPEDDEDKGLAFRYDELTCRSTDDIPDENRHVR